MNNRLFVERFRSALHGADRFVMRADGEWNFVLSSDACRITFSFERFGGGFTISVSEPHASVRDEMSFFVLRFLRSAKGDTRADSPESFSKVFNEYFDDLLAGNFAIRTKYVEVEDLFFDFYIKVNELPDSDPVKIKIKNFDISWIDDFKRREAAGV